jgi:hypothetical protein
MQRALVAALALAGALLTPAFAAAQVWEVEVHGGWLTTPEVSGGTTGLPAPGETFTTLGPFQSRRVSSWLVGDGADLMNAIASSNPGFNLPLRITPLDSVANTPLASRRSGGSAGFRVGRELTRQFVVEFNFDYASTPYEARGHVQSGLDATTSSFRTLLQNEVLLPSAIFVGKAITSSNALSVEGGSETLVTGAVRFNILTQGRLRPYVTGGGGVARYGGDSPTATAQSGYTFRFLNVSPFDERDAVVLTQTFDESGFVGLVGGGVSVYLRPTSGIRGDVRAHIGASTERVLLDATPSFTPGTPSIFFASLTSPSLSFSNFPQPSASPPSSLSGPAIVDFVSFESSKTKAQVTWSIGYFFRF